MNTHNGEINSRDKLPTLCVKHVDRDIIESNEEVYGENICHVYLVEESAEVIKELTKIMRNRGDRDKLVEEISDLYYTLSMLVQKYDITEEEINNNIMKKELEAREKLEEEKLERKPWTRVANLVMDNEKLRALVRNR